MHIVLSFHEYFLSKLFHYFILLYMHVQLICIRNLFNFIILLKVVESENLIEKKIKPCLAVNVSTPNKNRIFCKFYKLFVLCNYI